MDARSTSAPAAHSLSLVHLTKAYGGLRAVDDVSLDVPRGEFLTLLGPSGSGKTTLLMMIAGFVPPTSGDIFVDDGRITALPPERRNFGVVFQGYALFPHMTVAENVAYSLRVRGIRKPEIARRVRDGLAQVRLQNFAERLPRQLSGGQQQRVAIARALVFAPDVLLLDEPLGALDRQLRAEVQFELKAMHADLGVTFVYVTHDQDEALSMSDRIAIVNHGRLEQVATPTVLYEAPRTRFAAEFLGTSNCLDATILGNDGDIATLAWGGLTVRHHGRLPSGRRHALLALRPEKIAMSAAAPGPGFNAVAGVVEAIAYLGATVQAVVRCEAAGPMRVTAFAWPLAANLAIGSPVWLGWPPDATVLLDDPVLLDNAVPSSEINAGRLQ